VDEPLPVVQPAAPGAAPGATAADRLKAKGNSCYKDKDYGAAARHYPAAIAADGTVAALYANRSVARLELGDHAAAVADGTRAVQLEPQWARGHMRLGMAAAATNRRVGLEHLERAVALDAGAVDKAFMKELRACVATSRRLMEVGSPFLQTGDLARARPHFERSLAADDTNGDAWCNLSTGGEGGVVSGRRYSGLECAVKALTANVTPEATPEASSYYWLNFACNGGGQFQGRHYTKVEAWVKALEISPTCHGAWTNLGQFAEGHVTVSGVRLTSAECLVKSLEYAPPAQRVFIQWYALGEEGGGVVSGTSYNRTECFACGLELNDAYPPLWGALALSTRAGTKVKGVWYSSQQCVERALNMESTQYPAWWGYLGFLGGGRVHGRQFTAQECEATACRLHASQQ
jgi:tetratricopeptide (TPR) repeat protein